MRDWDNILPFALEEALSMISEKLNEETLLDNASRVATTPHIMHLFIKRIEISYTQKEICYFCLNFFL